jgi:hypothetical protein
MFNNKAKKAKALQSRILARKAARAARSKIMVSSYNWTSNNTDVKAVINEN